MQTRFTRATCLFCAMATTLGPAAAVPGREPLAEIKACMTDAAPSLHFNGALYVGRGKNTAQMNFGMADETGQTPIGNDTRFNIGSATKMFTAVAIARLVDQGALSFDDPIGKYLKDAPPQFAAITMRALLTHTAGLGDYFVPQNRAAIDAARTALDLLPLVFASPPAFAPGSAQAYSNSGFVVLGAIIETISGQRFGDFIEQEIFRRAGMTNSAMAADGGADPMTRMTPNRMLDKPVPSPMRSAHASPAGGLYSTAADMARFLGALQSDRLVRVKTKAELLMPRAVPGRSGPGQYGYGFTLNAGPPHRVGHGGGAPGVNAEIALYPEADAMIVALSNYDPPTASRMVTVLERALFAEDVDAACKAALADPALRRPPEMRPRA